MPSELTIHLVRHGESEANVDRTANIRMPDHRIPLSGPGEAQAVGAGRALAGILAAMGADPDTVAAYVSPYRRTRDTWSRMRHGIMDAEPDGRLAEGIGAAVESIHLRELEFGLFDGIADAELPREFPREHAHYEKHRAFEGEFYARMPSGESRCDVAQRVHQFFGTLLRDHERHGVRHAVVVSHGVTIRAFAMMWLGLPVEWMEREPNPGNCSIRTIIGGRWADLREGCPHAAEGYLHGGPRRWSDPAEPPRETGSLP